MKRLALVTMIGSLLLGTGELEAQRGDRGKNRDRNGRVERLEPVHAPGRVVDRRAYRPAPPHRGGRTRVVYRSGRPRTGYDAYGAWIRFDWARAVYFRPIVEPRRRAFLNQGELKALLGHRVVRQIRNAGRSVGMRGPMRGHWVYDRYDTILVVTMGGNDVAELVDYNGDGFVDETYLIGRRGYRPVVLGW